MLSLNITASLAIGGLFVCAIGGTKLAANLPSSIAETIQTAIPSPHSVPWFMEHKSEMKAKIAACDDNPGSSPLDAECENAAQAKQKLDINEFLQGAPK